MAQQVLGAVASTIYEAINLCSDPDQLQETARFLWKSYGAGELSGDEPNYLQFLIDRRRPLRRTGLHAKPLGKFAGCPPDRVQFCENGEVEDRSYLAPLS